MTLRSARRDQYGTILVDLEHHQSIALLADRQAKTLADWLREHPVSEVLPRDRSKAYKRAMRDERLSKSLTDFIWFRRAVPLNLSNRSQMVFVRITLLSKPV